MDIVKNILENSHFSYDFIYHNQPLLTAQEGADYFKIDIGQTAPTLIIKTGNDFFALILSGDPEHINLEQLAFILGYKKAQMASRDEVRKVTGFDAGNLPIIGITLPHILDKQLFYYPCIYGGSGQLNRTLKITPMALRQLNTIMVITTILR